MTAKELFEVLSCGCPMHLAKCALCSGTVHTNLCPLKEFLPERDCCKERHEKAVLYYQSCIEKLQDSSTVLNGRNVVTQVQ